MQGWSLERTLQLKQDGGLLAGGELMKMMNGECGEGALQQQQDGG